MGKIFDFNVRLGFSPQTYFERDIKACFLNDEINGIYYVNENDKNAKNNEIDQKVKAKIKEFKKDMNCIKKHLFVFVNSLNQPKLSNNKEANELVWFLCQVVTANRKNLVDEAIAKDESDEDFSDRMAIRRYFHAFHEWIEDGYNTKFITKKNSPFLMKNHFRDFLYYIHHNHKKYIPKEASYQAIDFKKAIDDFLPLAKNNHKIIALEKAVGSYIMVNVLEKNVISFTWEDHFAKYGQDYMKWMAIVVSAVALVYTAGVIFDIKVATIIDTLKKITRLLSPSPSNSLNENGDSNDLDSGRKDTISSAAQNIKSIVENGVKVDAINTIANTNNSIEFKENKEVAIDNEGKNTNIKQKKDLKLATNSNENQKNINNKEVKNIKNNNSENSEPKNNIENTNNDNIIKEIKKNTNPKQKIPLEGTKKDDIEANKDTKTEIRKKRKKEKNDEDIDNSGNNIDNEKNPSEWQIKRKNTNNEEKNTNSKKDNIEVNKEDINANQKITNNEPKNNLVDINNNIITKENKKNTNPEQKIALKNTIEKYIKKIFSGKPFVITGRYENNFKFDLCDFDALPEEIKKIINSNITLKTLVNQYKNLICTGSNGKITRLPKIIIFYAIVVELMDWKIITDITDVNDSFIENKLFEIINNWFEQEDRIIKLEDKIKILEDKIKILEDKIKESIEKIFSGKPLVILMQDNNYFPITLCDFNALPEAIKKKCEEKIKNAYLKDKNCYLDKKSIFRAIISILMEKGIISDITVVNNSFVENKLFEIIDNWFEQEGHFKIMNKNDNYSADYE